MTVFSLDALATIKQPSNNHQNEPFEYIVGRIAECCDIARKTNNKNENQE